MTTPPPNVVPLKSWCSLKTLREKYQTYLATQKNTPLALARYAETGVVHNAFTMTPVDRRELSTEEAPRPSEDSYLTINLFVYGRMLAHSQHLSNEQAQSDGEWSAGVLAVELCSLLDFKVETKFPARFGRPLRQMSIDHAGWVGLAAGIGALDVVERWTPLLLEAVRRGYVVEHDRCGMHHFILRLWCASRDLIYPGRGYPTYEVAEGVLKMWDTRDVETLAAWLEQLCNQHTQLSSAKQFMDFANDFSHVPVEILMLFRLRELKGLTNPEIDHPLMKFPWSRLQQPQKAQPDDLLQGIYRRLGQAEAITLDSLYRELLTPQRHSGSGQE